MTPIFSSLSDADLLTRLEQVCAQERNVTAQLVALLMEVDARKLYAQRGCSSLFTYCMQVLHFSEYAAYLRIEAARAARRFPLILDRLADGSVHLTAVGLLTLHLTPANPPNCSMPLGTKAARRPAIILNCDAVPTTSMKQSSTFVTLSRFH